MVSMGGEAGLAMSQQAWEASVPVQVPANIAGSSLSNLTVYLSNEDGQRINLLADRWSAQLILSF